MPTGLLTHLSRWLNGGVLVAWPRPGSYQLDNPALETRPDALVHIVDPVSSRSVLLQPPAQDQPREPGNIGHTPVPLPQQPVIIRCHHRQGPVQSFPRPTG